MVPLPPDTDVETDADAETVSEQAEEEPATAG